MKKLKFFAFALAASALAFTFTSCNGDDPIAPPPPPPPGIHLLGSAIGITVPGELTQFFPGINEYGQVLDERIHEMYTWLEPGTFQIVSVMAGEITRRIGGTETGYTYPGQDRTEGGHDQAWGARFYRPDVDGTFTITEAGLHHIAYFQGEPGTNMNPLIMIARVDMGMRGDFNGWGFTSLGTPSREGNTLRWDWEGELRSGNFKLAYNGGWKLPMLFVDGEPVWDVIMINTNLGGSPLIPGGDDILLSILPGTYRITLEWRPTHVHHGFSNLTFTPLDVDVVNPAEDWTVGLSGNAFPAFCEWCSPGDGVLAVFSPEQTTVTNNETFAGTYVWTISNLEMSAGGGFQLRGAGGDWIPRQSFEITGDPDNFSPITQTGNAIITEGRTYNITITVVFDGISATSRVLHFEIVQ